MSLVVWEDINKTLIALVRNALNQERPLDTQQIESLVKPYLAEIEQAVETRLKQERADADAEWMKKYKRTERDRKRLEFSRRLELYANVAVNSKIFFCHGDRAWSHCVKQLALFEPSFAQISITERPPQQTDLEGIWKPEDQVDMEKYIPFRKTFHFEGVDERFTGVFEYTLDWPSMVLHAATRAVPPSLEDIRAVLGSSHGSGTTRRLLEALEPLTNARHIRRNDFIEFFTKAASNFYGFHRLTDVAKLLEASSSTAKRSII